MVSLVAAEHPRAWAGWAARNGFLALVTDASDRAAALTSLLQQFPWSRIGRSARERFASVAGLRPEAIDAALDARGDDERWRWILDAVAHDDHALVAGWILASMRDARVRPSPFPAARLLAIACDLAAPIAAAFHTASPDPAWVRGALDGAAMLVAQMPRQPVAVVAPAGVLRAALGSDAGIVELEDTSPRARSRAEQTLFDALARDRRTAGRFALNQRVELEVDYEVDLVTSRGRIAVEIDGWYHFREPTNYRSDRRKDVVLQQGGYLVMRYLAEDIEERLALVVDEIALAVAAREGTR